MTDLTTITTPFGLLDEETKKLMQETKGSFEMFNGFNWVPQTVERNPVFYGNTTYRLKVEPPLPDRINWSHVASEWKWMARDEDEKVYLYREKPDEANFPIGEWRENIKDLDGYARIEELFSSFARGTLPWDQSLVKRGEGE